MIRTDGDITFGHETEAKLDAVTPNASVFFARELESIEARMYVFKKKELKYRELIPVSNSDSPGANNITYHMFDKVGMAQVIANFADDLPRADVFGKEFTQKVKSIGVSIGFNTQEIRAASMANVPLETMKADAQRRALREKESKIAWNGDADSGLIGFLDNVNIPQIAAPNGASPASPLWGGKTPDEIIADVLAMVTKIREDSKGTFSGDTLLLPIAQYNLIAGTPRSATSDTTIMEFLIKPGNTYGLGLIDWLPDELVGAIGGEDIAVLYQRDAEVLEQRIPLELQLLPVQERNLEFVINGEARNGGVVVRYPIATVILTGI